MPSCLVLVEKLNYMPTLYKLLYAYLYKLCNCSYGGLLQNITNSLFTKNFFSKELYKTHMELLHL